MYNIRQRWTGHRRAAIDARGPWYLECRENSREGIHKGERVRERERRQSSRRRRSSRQRTPVPESATPLRSLKPARPLSLHQSTYLPTSGGRGRDVRTQESRRCAGARMSTQVEHMFTAETTISFQPNATPMCCPLSKPVFFASSPLSTWQFPRTNLRVEAVDDSQLGWRAVQRSRGLDPNLVRLTHFRPTHFWPTHFPPAG